MKIAILEDDKQACNLIMQYLKQYESDNNAFTIDLLTCFDNGNDFLHCETYFDLIFLDIELNNDENGIQIATEFRKKNNSSSIIICTNLGKYAIKGYEIDAIAFCLKPLTYSDFYLKMEKFMAKFTYCSDFKIMIEDSSSTKHIINSSDIYYIEIIKHYLIYHTVNGNYKVRGKIIDCLDYLRKQLGGSSFYRINNGVIVNMAKIDTINKDVVVINNTQLVISRSKKKDFLYSLSCYIGEIR